MEEVICTVNEKVNQQIEDLLDKAYGSEEVEEVHRLAQQVLELDGDNVDGLVLLADTTEDDEERLRCLRRARELAAPAPGESFDLAEGEEPFYVGILHRLGGALLFEIPREAADVARELLSFDGEEVVTLGRPLLYASLLRLGEFDHVLEMVDKEEELQDGELSVEGAYARALALFRSKGNGEESLEALLEALGIAPDLPFYLLDFWVEPDEEEEDELYHIAWFLGVAWLDDEEALAWLTGAALALGYLTDRLPEEILSEMKPLLEEAELMELLDGEKRAIEMSLAETPDLSLDEIDFRVLDFLAAHPSFLGL